MTNEKRFWFVIDKGKLEYVQDKVTDEKITVSELEDLLNEMCEDIVHQQSFIGRKLLDFDKYLADRLNEEEIIIKEQENIIKQLDQKIKDKNEYQQVLESKIRRLKDRIKVLEK